MAATYELGDNFAAIGLAFEDEDEFVVLIERALTGGRSIAVDQGRYVVAADGNGAELWFGLDKSDQILSIDPYFRGKGTVRTQLTNVVQDLTRTGTSATLHGWAEPAAASDGSGGLYPFLVDVLDWAHNATRPLPFEMALGVAAFPWTVTVYDDEAAYGEETRDREPGLASQAFIPMGLFHAEASVDPPAAIAWFTGRVLERAVYQNPWGRGAYGWALLESAGGQFDLMLEPAALTSLPQIGAIVEVQARLLACRAEETA